MLNKLQVAVLSRPQNKYHVMQMETILGFADSIFEQSEMTTKNMFDRYDAILNNNYFSSTFTLRLGALLP